MPILVGPAHLTLFGNGCEAAPNTKFEIAPHGGGWWIDVRIGGVQLYDRSAPSNDAVGALALDEAEAAATLAALLDESPRPRPRASYPEGVTGIGTVTLKLPLDTGEVDLFVSDGAFNRLVSLAELMLALARRAGLTIHDRLHPIPAAYRAD